jgi:hypothetical protein
VARHQDFRRILDDKNIDVVVIATPNHWHAPMTIMACKAGKHVYVEKPVSHGIWEGRQMVKAARDHDRIVQAGTQHRSDPALRELAADLRSGRYGKVLWIHCSRLVAREPIGKVAEPVPVPNHIDYNLWAGPAPMTPVMRMNFHYDWHWQWNWGDGEMGNWGIHYVDDVLNFLELDTVPTRVIAAGNRFAWNDDGQTPNMHMALFDLKGIPLVVDIRNLPDLQRPEGQRAGGDGGAVYLRMRHGNYIMCEATRPTSATASASGPPSTAFGMHSVNTGMQSRHWPTWSSRCRATGSTCRTRLSCRDRSLRSTRTANGSPAITRRPPTATFAMSIVLHSRGE